jgi:hypothetical protein
VVAAISPQVVEPKAVHLRIQDTPQRAYSSNHSQVPRRSGEEVLVAYPKPLGEDGGGDLLELGHLGERLVQGGLVEEDGVVHLLLLLPLAPLLQEGRRHPTSEAVEKPRKEKQLLH